MGSKERGWGNDSVNYLFSSRRRHINLISNTFWKNMYDTSSDDIILTKQIQQKRSTVRDDLEKQDLPKRDLMKRENKKAYLQ